MIHRLDGSSDAAATIPTWSNDYPHPNSTWPKSWDVITRDLGHLSEETRSRLLRENVRQLYKLPALAPVTV